MKILYYDCFSGISGDMNLGAMVDLGVDRDYLISELDKLPMHDEFRLEIKKDSRKGITGTKVDVIVEEHHHEEEHHHHRHLSDVEEIVNDSVLNENVKLLSLKIFKNIAEAEAKVHGMDINEVHFHEVGAVDSIVDIVGAAICFDYLKIDKVMASSIELGGGFVKCAHGVIPVPAPATVEILKGIPVKSGAVPFETTTPTGAAIIAALVEEYSDNLHFPINKVAYGVGGRDTDIPNLLRVYLSEINENYIYDEAVIIECNIDDMSPEMYEYVMEKIFLQGAQDVFLTPIIMKKERPAVMLSVLCSREKEKQIVELILKETSTLGVREHTVNKKMLKRENIIVKTSFGDVSVKTAYMGDERVKFKAEYDDCKRISIEKNIPIKNIYEEIYKAMF